MVRIAGRGIRGMTGMIEDAGRRGGPGLVSLLAAVASVPAAAHAAPACHPASRQLAYACADPTLEAAISALGTAYDIASENASRIPGGKRRLRSGHSRWMRDMAACGTDEACLSASINERQQIINEMRLGRTVTIAADATPARPRYDPRTDPDLHREAPAPSYVAPYQDDRASDPVEPRTDWPVPPIATAPVIPAAIPPAHGGRADTGIRAMAPDEGAVSYARLLLGMLLSASIPTIAAMMLKWRGRMPTMGPRCPACHGNRIRSHAIGSGLPAYARRRGRGNGMSEVRPERIVRTCPCGYSSDGSVQAMDHRAELLLTRDMRIPD